VKKSQKVFGGYFIDSHCREVKGDTDLLSSSLLTYLLNYLLTD